jgi:DNA-binding transcriptional regulator YiaG
MLDMTLKGRTRRGNFTNPQHGEKNGNSKLTEKEVLEIRTEKGIVSQEELAKRYNVTSRTIRYVQSGKIWMYDKNLYYTPFVKLGLS